MSNLEGFHFHGVLCFVRGFYIIFIFDPECNEIDVECHFFFAINIVLSQESVFANGAYGSFTVCSV